MGIETIALAVAAVGAVTTVAGTIEQNRAGKKSAAAQKEAADISGAQQKNQEMEQRRQQVREQRIRTAQIQQSASNTGVAGSSGELGSIAALNTSTGSNIAFSKGATLASEGISAQNQNAADASMRGQLAGSIGQLGGSMISLGMAGGAAAGAEGLFGSTSKVDTDVSSMINSNPNLFG